MTRSRNRLRSAVKALKMDDREALANALRISVDEVNRAARNADLNAEAFLALCAGTGIDPVSAADVTRTPRPIAICWNVLAIALRMHRKTLKLNIRAGAKRAKVCVATMSRAEGGLQALSADSLTKLCLYLDRSPGLFTRDRGPDEEPHHGRLTGHVSRKTHCNTLAEQAA